MIPSCHKAAVYCCSSFCEHAEVFVSPQSDTYRTPVIPSRAWQVYVGHLCMHTHLCRRNHLSHERQAASLPSLQKN